MSNTRTTAAAVAAILIAGLPATPAVAAQPAAGPAAPNAWSAPAAGAPSGQPATLTNGDQPVADGGAASPVGLALIGLGSLGLVAGLAGHVRSRSGPAAA